MLFIQFVVIVADGLIRWGFGLLLAWFATTGILTIATRSRLIPVVADWLIRYGFGLLLAWFATTGVLIIATRALLITVVCRGW